MKYHRYKPNLEETYSQAREVLKEDKKLCRSLFDKPLKKVTRVDITEWAIRKIYPWLPGDMDKLILMEEWDWIRQGSHVYFPVPGLLSTLIRSKMDVDVDAFDLPSHPFIVAIPDIDADSHPELRPFLVHYASGLERQELARYYSENVLHVDMDLYSTDNADLSEKRMHVTAQTGTIPGVGNMQQRLVAPMSMVETVLRNARAGIEELETIRELGLNEPLTGSVSRCTDEEAKIQFLQVKMAIHLAIYMKAFPESIRDGFPSQMTERSGFRPSPHALGEQHLGDGMTGTHGSPGVHWRKWHFRTYPRRRDGTKRPGLIPIGGMMVGRGKPHTILNNENKKENDR